MSPSITLVCVVFIQPAYIEGSSSKEKGEKWFLLVYTTGAAYETRNP